MAMHSCPKCGRPTEGAWSEGGLRWAICEDCMEAERREARLAEARGRRGQGGNRALEDLRQAVDELERPLK